jgi:hypothetical protein
MRAADRKRLRSVIIGHLEEFPRQYAALESAMSAFGESFELQQFKQAFNTADDMRAYNRVQAVERSLGRVQNFVAELAIAGVRLAELKRPPMRPDGSEAQQAFECLRDGGVLDGQLCAQLTRVQKARTRIEHSYVNLPAGDVHRAAELVRDTARRFLDRYRDWIAPFLTHTEDDGSGTGPIVT